MKLKFSQQIFEKYSIIRFHESLSNRNPAVPCRQADEWTDMTMLKAAFCNSANAPKKQ